MLASPRSEGAAGISSPFSVCRAPLRRGPTPSVFRGHGEDPGRSRAHPTYRSPGRCDRVHGIEKAELLDHGERGPVAALDPAGAQPDVLRGRSRHGDQEGRRRARDARVEVVFGEPIPPVAKLLSGPCEVDGVSQGLGGGRPRAHGNQIEDPQRDASAWS